MEMKSDKVLAFHREYLIKDEFSEVNNQQQNVVETGGIRWLKLATHVLLDMTNTQYLHGFLQFFMLQIFITLLGTKSDNGYQL